MSTIERAIAIALEAHEGQRDKLEAPYILHPLRVMLRCRTEEQMLAAVLHDVVEDGRDWTFERLREEGFSERVISAVEALTKREGEAYGDFVDRVCRNELARTVKLADVSDNLDLGRLSKIEDEAERMRLAAQYLDAYRRLTGNGG